MTTGYLPGLKYTILHVMEMTMVDNYKAFYCIKFKPRYIKKEVKVREEKTKEYVELEPCSGNSRALYRERACLEKFYMLLCYVSSLCSCSSTGSHQSQKMRKKIAYKTESYVKSLLEVTLIERSKWYFLPFQIRGLCFVLLPLAKKYDNPPSFSVLIISC